MTSSTFTAGPAPNTVRAADGKVVTVPEGWILLSPGDAALTRRVKAAGYHWVVAEKKGRKVFSRGIWTSAATVERIRADLDADRSTQIFAKKKEADARRRDKAQAEYVEDFLGAVVTFLAFHPTHADLAHQLARAVTDHATPVGSGTVARTKRIPVEQRAEAAVIAWMRHQTTGYDGMVIPRVKGKRREVRRMLAARSKELLARYRQGGAVPEGCPLKKALASGPVVGPTYKSGQTKSRPSGGSHADQPSYLRPCAFLPVLADEKKADDEPKKPAELRVLDRLIGSWKDEATFKVSEWTKKERQETATFQNSWTLNGWFVQYRGRNGDGGEDLQLMTFDVEKKVFRRWYYDSDGNVSESSGKWDAKTATLTWTGDLGDGITAVSVWRFVDKDTTIWSRVAKDGKGKIYSNIEGKAVRQK